MIKVPENITIIFDEEGKSFTDIIEQIVKILIKSTEDGEAECKKKL